ncbi:major facilitator superfamily domain-containing protein 10 isoform X1 [Synchiropus splendidus]|uniref:major facilitator superfamily domain-containing protein 10 isoform X1 n=2 Tax=Synchiropus splendidus TaxID=270530 RepID=UPI00237DE408|nr:major facilitator superfamily domain-containing protein 10 isoform X1 [Synchiropus splendidus]XP_053727800.1 major facilitator superfamily domain-containing protein 10 isoform X1 [Synchiropus splendidus]XP_053727801.1 major facilitator superfamily domain-containing protein 10 isoform X1 [Synchiropus splendidus]
MTEPPDSFTIYGCFCFSEIIVIEQRMSTTGMSDEESLKLSTKIIKVVFVTLLLDLLGFTLILPLLPSILDHYAQNEDGIYRSMQNIVDLFREAVGIPLAKKYNSVLFGGLIGSLFSLLQFVSSPLAGTLSDRYGRRPLLILATLGLMTSYAVWAVAQSFSMFLVFRVIGGISKSNVSLCTAVMADLPCPKARNRGMAMIGVAFSLGFTVGPLMGAYFTLNNRITENVYHTPAVLALAFSAADLVFICLLLPETLKKDVKTPCSGFRDVRDLLSPLSLFRFSAVTRSTEPPTKERMRRLQVLGLVYFCYLFLFSGLEFSLSFLTHQRFHFTSMQQGKMFFFIGILMALIQGGYARRMKPGQHIQAVSMAITILIPAFILIGLSWNLTMLYAGLALYSFAAAVVVPCLSTLVAEHGSVNQKGTVMGILRSLGSLARAMGPIVSSSVYWIAGAQTCFLLTAASFVVPLVLLKSIGRAEEGHED